VESLGLSWEKADEEMKEGLAAYAHRQSNIRISLHGHFTTMWRNVDEYIEHGTGGIDEETIDIRMVDDEE
jgi:hypothetical protein